MPLHVSSTCAHHQDVTVVEVCMWSIICYISGWICYGFENYGFGSLHDDYVRFVGATPQFYSEAPCRFNYCFV